MAITLLVTAVLAVLQLAERLDYGQEVSHRPAGMDFVFSLGGRLGQPYTTIAKPRKEAWWLAKHSNNVARAKQGGIDVLFLGDSITEMMDDKQLASSFSSRVDHFGIRSDGTQHLLWRLQNGELDFPANDTPKVVVVLIGTNNIQRDVRLSARARHDVFLGIKANVDEIRRKLPRAKVLVLGVLPREGSATHGIRSEIVAINTELAALADGHHVWFSDTSNALLESDGSLSKQTMSDFLHPTPTGFDKLFNAIRTQVDTLSK